MIELKHISKVFPTPDGALQALRDIDLTIQDGDVFGIVGMSGAGKSTLVRCINLLERPTQGQVLIDGRDLCAMPEKELIRQRRSIAMIFQQFNLLMQRTCLKNICFPMEIAGVNRDEAIRRAREYLDIVGLPDKADAYPAQLSGGQRQRIAIARALASDPKILLCDEATSALDPKTTREILRLVRDINQRLGITVVVITHEMAVVEEICSHANVIRIAFNGGSSYEPLIASLAIDCGVKANILGADTRNVNGQAFGTMLLGLPDDPEQIAKAMNYIKTQPNVTVEEVRDYHG